jgi:hypothetical protein
MGKREVEERELCAGKLNEGKGEREGGARAWGRRWGARGTRAKVGPG